MPTQIRGFAGLFVISGPLFLNACGSHDIAENILKVIKTPITLTFKRVVIINGTWQDKIV